MNIHPLTPVENEIVVEICRYLAANCYGQAFTAEVIGVLGCWGDTLPEEDILALLHQINSSACANRN